MPNIPHDINNLNINNLTKALNPATPIAGDNVIVTVKSAWFSKINWGEAVKVFAAGALAFFGIEVSQEMQIYILQAIIGIGAAYTWITKTWFTNSVAPASMAK